MGSPLDCRQALPWRLRPAGLSSWLRAGRAGEEAGSSCTQPPWSPLHTCRDSSTCMFHVCPAGHQSAVPSTRGLPPVEMGGLGRSSPCPQGGRPPRDYRSDAAVQRKCGRCRRGPELAGRRCGPRCFRFQRRDGASGFKGAFHTRPGSVPVLVTVTMGKGHWPRIVVGGGGGGVHGCPRGRLAVSGNPLAGWEGLVSSGHSPSW